MHPLVRPAAILFAGAMIAGAAGAGATEYIYRHSMPVWIPVKTAPAEGEAALVLPSSVALAALREGGLLGTCTDVPVRNVGSGRAEGLSATLSGADAPAFEICTPAAAACGTSVAGGASCHVGLRLAATGAGSYAAALTVAASGIRAASAPVTGEVVAQPVGSAFGIGYDLYGQIGGSGNQRMWTSVGGDGDWVAIAAGTHHGYALKRDGSLWGIGFNSAGQIGGSGDRSSWTRVGPGDDWTAVAAGNGSGYGLRRDGSIWGIGFNSAGQIGGSGNRGEWAPIGPDRDWIAVAAGTFHAYALKRDGTLWGIGHNQYGQIGGAAHRSEWVRIGSDRDWISVVAGSYHGYALKRDGSI